MIQDSLRLFLDSFCKPSDVSAAYGMKFAAKASRIGLGKKYSVWLRILPGFDRLHILMVHQSEEGELEATSELDLAQADFQSVIKEIESMASDLASVD